MDRSCLRLLWRERARVARGGLSAGLEAAAELYGPRCGEDGVDAQSNCPTEPGSWWTATRLKMESSDGDGTASKEHAGQRRYILGDSG